MVLMSGANIEKPETLKNGAGDYNPDSLSSDSGVSSGKEDSSTGSGSAGGHRERSRKSSSSTQSQSSGRKDRNSDNFDHHTFPRGRTGSSFGSSGGERDYSKFFEDDPFFADKAKFFGRSKLGNKPRLSERIFGKRPKGRSSVFDNDNFVEDLRKRIQEEKKMFFDGGSDPFASSFGGRPSSPVGGRETRAGFPGFDDLRTGARARFDEFATRHPMFSTMRNQPAWNLDDHFGHHHHGFDSFPRERHNSGSSGGGSGASTASTGEERVIPIQIIRDDAPKSQQPRGKSPAPPPVDVTPRIIREKTPPQQQQQQPPQQTGPQRCNTEPNHTILIEDHRGARAHSAPPVSQNGVDPTPKAPADSTDSKPQTTQFGGNNSKTPKAEKQIPTANNGMRSIPIIIEGRKGPTVNSAAPNGNCNTGNESPPQPKVSRPAERSPTPPPKKPAPPKDPLAQVQAVLDEVKELEKQVDEYKGNSREERDYLLLDEFLTRCLIKLDVVETEGRDDVRTSRKDCIKYIQSCISKLEKKAPLPQKPEENNGQQMETGEAKAGETEKMDTGSQPPQPTTEEGKPPQFNNDTSKIGNSEEKMDVDPSSNSNTNSCANGGVDAQPNGGGSGDGGGDNANANDAAADQQPVKA